MSVNYTITEYPITDLTAFQPFEGQNWFPQNIGGDPGQYYGVFGEGLNDPVYAEAVGGVFLTLKITPTDASLYEVKAEDFTIAGLNPNYEEENDCNGCSSDSYPGTLSEKKLRRWDELAQTTNIIGNPMTIALHPWVSSVIMEDTGPNETNNYVNEIIVVAWMKPQIEIPPIDYNINLDIDGDAVLLPVPYSGFEFNVYCKIVGPQIGNPNPCARVYPIIPQCYGTTTNGFTLTPISSYPYTTAGVKVTYNGPDEQAALQFNPECGIPSELQQGITSANIQSWFGITPTLGKTLSRLNVSMGPNMYAPPGSNWGFTEEEVTGVVWNTFSGAPDGVLCPSAYYNDGLVGVWGTDDNFGQDGATAIMYDIDGTFLDNTTQEFGFSSYIDWRAKLSYTNQYTNAVTDYDYWWLCGEALSEGGNVYGGWPDNPGSNPINPSTAYIPLNNQYQGSEYIYFTDTLPSMATTGFAATYFNYQPCDDGFTYAAPCLSGCDDVLYAQQSLSQLAEQDPEFFNENNVIVSFGGLDGYIPGPNPPDITIEVTVDNCGMYIANDFEEDEWFYFNELNIIAEDDENDQSDDVIISGGEESGGGSFDIDWGDDE